MEAYVIYSHTDQPRLVKLKADPFDDDGMASEGNKPLGMSPQITLYDTAVIIE